MPGKQRIKFPASNIAEPCAFSPALDPAHAATGERVLNTNPDPEYLLRATFTAANQSFNDGDIIGTTGEGVEDGRLDVMRNAAGDAVDISSNDLFIDGTVLNFAQTSITGKVGFPKVIPRAALLKYASTHGNPQGQFGLSYKYNNVDTNAGSNNYNQIITINGNMYPDGATNANIGALTPASAAEFAFVTGGFNGSELPVDDADNAHLYMWGGFKLQHNGTDWTNLYINPFSRENVTPFVHCMNSDATVDQITIPDETYAASIVPTFRDVSVSDSDTFTHDADQVMLFSISTLPTTDCYIDVRRTDDDNRWRVNIDSAGNLELFEVASATTTSRGSSASAVTVGDHFLVICDDETITIHRCRDRTTNHRLIHYTSAASNKTATGGRVTLDSAVIDYIAGWPRTGYTDIPQTDNLPAATSRNPASATDHITVFVGDSMFDGNALERQSCPQMYQQLMGGTTTVHDDSVGGYTTAQVDSNMGTSNARMGTGDNDLHILCGTNDLYTNGDSAATVTTSLETLIDQELAYTGGGGETWTNIFIWLIADRQQGGGAISAAEHTTRRTTINANMVTKAATDSKLHIVDWISDRTVTGSNGNSFTLRGWADSQNTEYGNGDDVHPNYIGSGMMAEHGYRVKKAI